MTVLWVAVRRQQNWPIALTEKLTKHVWPINRQLERNDFIDVWCALNVYGNKNKPSLQPLAISGKRLSVNLCILD